MKHILFPFFLLGLIGSAKSQGPPIDIDKPIMVGAKTFIGKLKTKTIVHDGRKDLEIAPELRYAVSEKWMLQLRTPFILSGIDSFGSHLGDVDLKTKFQFLRKDEMGKTLRSALTAKATFPSGKNYEDPHLGYGNFRWALGLVAGYETLRYGLVSEINFQHHGEVAGPQLVSKLGSGIPLLKVKYPANQINLYQEFKSALWTRTGHHQFYLSPGIQWAYHKMTLDCAIELPVQKTGGLEKTNTYTFIFGGRFFI